MMHFTPIRYSYNYGRPGCFYCYGEEKVTVKYAVHALVNEERPDKYGGTERLVAYRKFVYEFDVNGNLARVSEDGTDFDWVSSSYWFDE